MPFNFHPNVTAQQLADILPNGVAILNHQHELISANRRFRELIPCSTANFRECWLQSVHPDDYERVDTGYREAARSKQALRIEYYTQDPGSMWCVLTLKSLENTDLQNFGLGDNGGFICTVADTTQEKKAELLQRQAAQDAEARKQKQERFIDMISHEIRNPLSAILHCTEDILEAVHSRTSDQLPLMDIIEAAETISLCINHQRKIVNDVLTYSKLDASMLALSPQRVQPKQDLTKSLAMFRPEIRKHHIQFEYIADSSYVECGIDWVMADLDRISQVLINLLSNAIKFTAKSETSRMVRVSIGASIERPSSYPPNVVFFQSGEEALREDATNTPDWGNGQIVYIMVAVKDSGIGISDQTQKRLFQRFNQATPKTESTYGGSGLGLSVSRKLCHLHGGEIGVSAKEGQGSTFGFFFKVRRSTEASDNGSGRLHASEMEKLATDIQALGNELRGVNRSTEVPKIPENPPVASVGETKSDAIDDARTIHTSKIARQVSHETERDQPSSSNNRRSEKRDGSHHILLVEDNIINRRIISRRLKTLGFQISEASNGHEALDAARNSKFDCILMDQEMPIMDGCTTTKAIRDLEQENSLHTPVLGVTANARAAQKTEMLDAGMDDIIYKPYSTDEIVEKIDYLTDHSSHG
ncbi:uncharacterized protein N7482_002652 [Penicillium canariense]|uniref:Uncharacterized protein n=1 Tax=Penicillium canariense TaxID=189055 RepID=A0A9W9IGG8_9EURO|nr:uncharacterized protein N7482_002652 [Penicillium canariense]KAJ5176775.1 hypothetical protein N7482_002652 [Penicillium canariense]